MAEVRVHFINGAEAEAGGIIITGCGLAGSVDPQINTEFDTIAGRRLDITSTPKKVTCQVCRRSRAYQFAARAVPSQIMPAQTDEDYWASLGRQLGWELKGWNGRSAASFGDDFGRYFDVFTEDGKLKVYADNAEPPPRCPACNCNWRWNPPATVDGSDQVRCEECDAVSVRAVPATENDRRLVDLAHTYLREALKLDAGEPMRFDYYAHLIGGLQAKLAAAEAETEKLKWQLQIARAANAGLAAQVPSHAVTVPTK